MLNRVKLQSEKGYTIVELLIVVLVILTLIGGLLFAGNKLLPKSEVASASKQLDAVKSAIFYFYGDTKKHPKSFDDLVAAKLLSAPDTNVWSMSCTNQGPLSVTMVAGESLTEIQTKFAAMCEATSVESATGKVDCTVVATAFCP